MDRHDITLRVNYRKVLGKNTIDKRNKRDNR
jgi:hypothetical protein